MAKSIELISKLQDLLQERGYQVSELEFTAGNYDDHGKLIESEIPTITTDFCEIGAYGDVCYFTIILKSSLFSKNLFGSLSTYPEVHIYGFKNFLEDYYPRRGFVYEELEKQIGLEDLTQIHFNFDSTHLSAKTILDNYFEIKTLFEGTSTEVVNQLNEGLLTD